MAAFRFELLLAVVYLTGTLLLASARGWQPIDETQLLNMYATGGWVKPDIVSGKRLPITQHSLTVAASPPDLGLSLVDFEA